MKQAKRTARRRGPTKKDSVGGGRKERWAEGGGTLKKVLQRAEMGFSKEGGGVRNHEAPVPRPKKGDLQAKKATTKHKPVKRYGNGEF